MVKWLRIGGRQLQVGVVVGEELAGVDLLGRRDGRSGEAEGDERRGRSQSRTKGHGVLYLARRRAGRVDRRRRGDRRASKLNLS